MTDMERNVYLEDIPLDVARARLEAALRDAGRWEPFDAERVPLADALGRVTAEPIYARRSSPHYHAAAMDGYAVAATATRDATETRPRALVLGADAHPVNTGDPLPPGTDAVIMIEDVTPDGPNHIAIRAAVAPYQHVRLMGEDVVVTDLVLPVNHRLRPVDLGVLAAAGYADAPVRRRPRVVIVPTGNELVPPTQEPAPGQVVEYNSLVLQAQVTEVGGAARVAPAVPDDRAALRAALDDALAQRPDLVLILSGSSAGSKDFTASVLREAGTLLVHGIAVRPGHPVILGVAADTPVVGVPGFPVSAALTGELFVQPLLGQWLGVRAGLDARPTVRATLTRKLVSPAGDDDYVRVSLARVGERLLATPLARGAGVITSLARADGLAQVPRFSEGADAGAALDVRLVQPLALVERTVAIAGSHDSMLDLLGQFIARRHPGERLSSAPLGSLGGLIALKRDEAHVAGTHMLDGDTGEYNVSYVQRYLAGIPLRLVTFAHREQGFLVAPGNPLGIASFDDLPRVRYVNRQRGAGTRILLDYEIGKRGIAPEQIAGYAHEETTHMGVAASVASGVADCGLAVRSAALSLGLDFIPVGWERYDLVVPDCYADHPGVRHLLALLADDEFRAALGARPGYGASETGREAYWQA